MVKVIVFDLGNVLIPFNYDKIRINLNKIDKGLGDRFKIKYEENFNIHNQLETQDISDEEFLSIMIDWAEGKVNKEEFCKIYSEIFTINDFTTGLLSILKKNYRIILLSNTNEIHRKYGYSHYKFLNEFEKLFLSHQVGHRKPEKEIYKTVMNYTRVSGNEHLFIDDVEEYINGAKKLGWDTIHFIGNENLKNELLKRNIVF